MPNEWKVLERAVERFNLSNEEHDEYLSVVTDIYGDAISSSSGFDNFGEEYYEFLNREVFSDDRLVSLLVEFGVPNDQLDEFRAGEVDCGSLVKRWNEMRFRIDELVDFAMLLKLVHDYSSKSESGMIESRYRFQKLLYLVNKNLSEQEDPSAIGPSRGDLGMLDKTGYRYRFTKRDAGPFAADAYEDKHRLFAWGLIDEPVVDDKGTGEVAERNRRYGIKLAPAGEIMVEKFYDRIDKSDSFMLSSWDFAQRNIIEEVSQMSHEELSNRVIGIETLQKAESGDELLVGPARKFKASEISFLDELTGEFAHA